MNDFNLFIRHYFELQSFWFFFWETQKKTDFKMDIVCFPKNRYSKQFWHQKQRSALDMIANKHH